MTARRKHLIGVTAAMIAFAANSLLCRLALRAPAAIDPASFTAVRLVSGAIVLALIVSTRERRFRAVEGSWPSALALFGYAIAFSIAYVRLSAGTGALILFAAVQLTMFSVAIARGERPGALQWLGLVVALGGLVVLTWRGVTAPDPPAAALMALAGFSWGIYSLRGRRSVRPIADTAGNFIRATPFAIVASAIAIEAMHLSSVGLALAITSGAIASGLGYSIWYLVLPRITATRAAVVQLSVPLIAAVGGIVLLGETASLRLAVAAAMILGGIAMAVLSRTQR